MSVRITNSVIPWSDTGTQHLPKAQQQVNVLVFREHLQRSSPLLSAYTPSKSDGSQVPEKRAILCRTCISQLLLSFCWHSNPLLSEGDATWLATGRKQLSSLLRHGFSGFVWREKCTGGTSISLVQAAPLLSSVSLPSAQSPAAAPALCTGEPSWLLPVTSRGKAGEIGLGGGFLRLGVLGLFFSARCSQMHCISEGYHSLGTPGLVAHVKHTTLSHTGSQGPGML